MDTLTALRRHSRLLSRARMRDEITVLQPYEEARVSHSNDGLIDCPTGVHSHNGVFGSRTRFHAARMQRAEERYPLGTDKCDQSIPVDGHSHTGLQEDE